jgi:hypothetical protein
MFVAAYNVIEGHAPKMRSIVESEFKKVAQTLTMIEAELATGELSTDEATLLIDMQKSATRAVLLMSQGLSLLLAERAINSALAVVRTAVNTAAGIALL